MLLIQVSILDDLVPGICFDGDCLVYIPSSQPNQFTGKKAVKRYLSYKYLGRYNLVKV